MIKTLPSMWFESSLPLVFGHRGNSSQAPENTMAAFQSALDAEADGIELDVHLTSDGYPVVIHNDTVDATTDGSGLVEALALSEIELLDAGSHFSADFAGERVPLLRDVLGTFAKDMLVNIELKPSRERTQALVEAVTADVEYTGSQQAIWFSSFDPNALRAMHAYRPDLPCGFLYSPVSFWRYILISLGDFSALHPHYSMVTESRVRNAHKRGQRMVVWTVDEARVARKLAGDGVDVLITNDPAGIRWVLTGR